MVSELVTNGLRHGAIESGQRIELSVTLVAGLLRVEVCDPPRIHPEARTTDSPDGTGWGLFLVARLWPTAGG